MLKKIAIIYHFFPHYRAGIIKKLHKSELECQFFGSQNQSEFGIKPFIFDNNYNYCNSPFYRIKNLYFQIGFYIEICKCDISHVIFLANPNFISTWIGAILARLTGKKVLFWTHGWLRKEGRVKTTLRNTFFRLANSMLVYGERSRDFAILNGFDAEKIYVIYNSLDHTDQIYRRHLLASFSKEQVFGKLFNDTNLLTIICTARLTKQCRFDVLLKAASELKINYGIDSNIVLVGNGPELVSLQRLASSKNLNIAFIGECYDEDKLSKLIYHSDLTVSPGKVGLTAIHSLTYGTPVFSHGNFDNQMPEFESIVPGHTGGFFSEGSSPDLARVIFEWQSQLSNRESIRKDCYHVVDSVFNPEFQLNIIRRAILDQPSAEDFRVKSIFQNRI